MGSAHADDWADPDRFEISIEGGQVWLRWAGADSNVRLGDADAVFRTFAAKMAEYDLQRRDAAAAWAPAAEREDADQGRPEDLAEMNFRIDPDLDPGR